MNLLKIYNEYINLNLVKKIIVEEMENTGNISLRFVSIPYDNFQFYLSKEEVQKTIRILELERLNNT